MEKEIFISFCYASLFFNGRTYSYSADEPPPSSDNTMQTPFGVALRPKSRMLHLRMHAVGGGLSVARTIEVHFLCCSFKTRKDRKLYADRWTSRYGGIFLRKIRPLLKFVCAVVRYMVTEYREEGRKGCISFRRGNTTDLTQLLLSWKARQE